MYKTGNPCSECPGNTVCSQQYPGLCQSNGAAGQLPVIVPEISSNVPTNTLDQMRPSTPLGIIVRYTTDLGFMDEIPPDTITPPKSPRQNHPYPKPPLTKITPAHNHPYPKSPLKNSPLPKITPAQYHPCR